MKILYPNRESFAVYGIVFLYNDLSSCNALYVYSLM